MKIRKGHFKVYNFSKFGYDNKKKINDDFNDKNEFEKKYRRLMKKYYGITKNQNRLEFEEIAKINEFIDEKIKNIDRKEKNNFDEKVEINCPKCGCNDLNKNGIARGRQRYICKKCRITFDKRSFSPLSNTKLSLEKWAKYLQLMLENRSIRNCAEAISVSVPTSFYMRHRILDILNYSTKDEMLNGIVQVAFGFVNESFKGVRINHKIFDDKSLKLRNKKQISGKKENLKQNFKEFNEDFKNIDNKQRLENKYLKEFKKNKNQCINIKKNIDTIKNIDNKDLDYQRNKKYLDEKYYYNFEKQNLRDNERFLHNKFAPNNSMKYIRNSLICITTALDIDGNIVTGVVDGFSGTTNGKLKRNNFISFFEGKFGRNIVLYTDHLSTFFDLKEKYNIELKQAVRIWSNSMNNVFVALRFNDKFKIWNKRFKGVATKYLNNYLSWFKFLFKYEEIEALDKVKFLLNKMITMNIYVPIKMIKDRKIETLK